MSDALGTCRTSMSSAPHPQTGRCIGWVPEQPTAPVAAPNIVDEPLARLSEWIRARMRGGCLLLSKGHGCICPLCDLDRIASRSRA